MGKSHIGDIYRSLLPYAVWVCCITGSALYLLVRFFNSGLPELVMSTAALIYLSLTAYRVQSILGIQNAFGLIIASTAITFTGEAIGVNTGWIFGSYHYTHQLGPSLLGVPIVIVLVWNVLILASYLIVSGLLRMVLANQPDRFGRVHLAVILGGLTGLSTMSIDLIIDPIAVDAGLWVWHGGGRYFAGIGGGVPVENFLGWFTLPAVAIFLFELCFNSGSHTRPIRHQTMAPYVGAFVAMIALALVLGHKGPALVGGIAMGWTIGAYLVTAWRHRSKEVQ